MDSSVKSDEERQAGPNVGPWVVELKIAGCTFRRRAARRRHLLDPGRVLQTISPA